MYNWKNVHKKSSRERYILNIFNRTELWVIVNHSLQVNMIAEVPQQYFPQNIQERFGSPAGYPLYCRVREACKGKLKPKMLTYVSFAGPGLVTMNQKHAKH